MANEVTKITLIIDDKGSASIRAVGKEMGAVEKRAKQATSSMDKFRKGMIGIGVAAAGITAALALAKRGFDLAREGAVITNMQVKFDRLAQSIGTTGEALQKDLRIGARGLVDDFTLMNGAMELMSLGLVNSHADTLRLANVSNQLGFDMNNLVLTLTNMRTMRFDQLGLRVEGFQKKVKALEKQGLSASAAFKEAFLQQAEEQLKLVGSVADTTLGKFLRLESGVKSMAQEFKITVAESEALGAALDGVVWIVDQLRDETQEYESLLAGDFVSTLENIGELAGLLTLEWFNQKREAKENKEALEALNPAIMQAATSSDTAMLASAGFNTELSRIAGAAAGGTAALKAQDLALSEWSDKAIGARLISSLLTDAMLDENISLQEAATIRGVAAQAGVDLGESFGEQISNYNDFFAEFEGGADPVAIMGGLLNDVVRNSPYNVEFNILTTGVIPDIGGTTFTEAIQATNITATTQAQEHASGGLLGPGVNLVGERGPEFIVGGRVFDTATTMGLLASGVFGSFKKHAVPTGQGAPSYNQFEATPTIVEDYQSLSILSQADSQPTATSTVVASAASTAQTAAAISSSVESAVVPAITAMAVAMPSSQSIASGIQEATLAQVRAQLKSTQQTNETLVQMLDVLSEQGTVDDLGRAVRDSVQSLI